MATRQIELASVSIHSGLPGAEGLWLLKRSDCMTKIAEQLDELVNLCRFYELTDESNLLQEHGQDVRKTTISITAVGGEQHSVTVTGHGDTSDPADLIVFIKEHGSNQGPG